LKGIYTPRLIEGGTRKRRREKEDKNKKTRKRRQEKEDKKKKTRKRTYIWVDGEDVVIEELMDASIEK
jgi:hypothetical protein